MTESGKNRRDFDEWEAVFEDSDPTRVLDSPAFGQAPEDSPTSSFEDAGVSATRYQRASQPPQAAQPSAPFAAGWGSRAASSPHDLRRVQFIPAFCGALVAYALIRGGLVLGNTVMGLLGVSTYPGLTEAVMEASAPSTRAQALPWLITVALLLALAFGCAGYTASRMTALAPSKQAVGVFAVSILGTLLATLLTWVTAHFTHPISPSYALQPLLTPDAATGVLTALAACVLAMLGALLGAGLGTRYHRALTGVHAHHQ
ncbi:hypothetical protein [Rothia sp. 88186D007BW]